MNLNKIFFPFILIASICARIFSIEYLGDKSIVYNEFGIILFNLENYGIFGFRQLEGQILPNIFMPPLYPFFLYFVKIINPFNNYNVELILYIQLVYSMLGVYFFKKLLMNFFSNNLSNAGALIFALFPLNVYSVSQISSISLQSFLLVLYFYLIFKIIKEKNSLKNLLYFSTVSSTLVLLRGEFLLIYFFTLLFIYFYNRKTKFIISSLIISILVISPYLIRNYKIFNTITLTKSFGYNLWKGNNPYSSVSGFETIERLKVIKKIEKIKSSPKYDLIIDEIFLEEAVDYIKSDPVRYLNLYFEKVFSFLFLDLKSTYPNYYNLAHILPKIILSITTLFGAAYLLRQKSILNFFTGYYFFNIFLFSIFFIIPRYSLILLPAQIILSCYFFKKLILIVKN